MKAKLNEFDRWLRHKVTVVILKKWKIPTTTYKNLMKMNLSFKNVRTDEDIYKVANSRLGLYEKASDDMINFILNSTILSYKNKKRGIIGLINPLEYYLAK